MFEQCHSLSSLLYRFMTGEFPLCWHLVSLLPGGAA